MGRKHGCCDAREVGLFLQSLSPPITLKVTMEKLKALAQVIRYYCVQSTTEAGSGHLTSSLSAVDVMTTLMFGGFFAYDLMDPDDPNNDRLIFSKGHASPLFYTLWAMTGAFPTEELLQLRTFESRLEGHPSMRFPFTEVATGSLGQGLSVGVGMALNAKHLDRLPCRTYVLLGDSEMSEGSNWEAMQLAAHYKLHNLIGIIDMNRLGQRGETMQGRDAEDFSRKAEAFGWHPMIVDGHDLEALKEAFSLITTKKTPEDKPIMMIAKTIKGKGVSFLEDQDNWHGKALTREQAEAALKEIGEVDLTIRGDLAEPERLPKFQYKPNLQPAVSQESSEDYNTPIATRKAYGHALVEIHPKHPSMVVLDAEMSNSTFAETFKKAYPERFFEMFIAEQNMVGVALGLAARGKLPFVSTFGAFFTRAFDQLRMAAYSQVPMICVGSHVGVSIGEDGPSQMGLEDIALFSSLYKSVVVSPADHVSSEKLTEALTEYHGISYMRTTKLEVEPLYSLDEEFEIGGSKTLKTSPRDDITIIATGVTLHEALKAYPLLLKNNINVRLIDAYSIKPIDTGTLQKAARETKAILTVEDHYPHGGLGDAVRQGLSGRPVRIYSLAVSKMPRSGKPQQLLEYEDISTDAIVEKVQAIMAGM